MKTDSVAKPLNEANVARRESNCRAGVQGGRRRPESSVASNRCERLVEMDDRLKVADTKVVELQQQVKRLQKDYEIAQNIWEDADRIAEVGRCAMEASSAMRTIVAKVVGIKKAVAYCLMKLMEGLDVRPLTDAELEFAEKHGVFTPTYDWPTLDGEDPMLREVSLIVLRKIKIGVECFLVAHECPPSFSDKEKAVVSFWAHWEMKGRRMIKAIEEFDADFLKVAQTAAYGEYRFI